MADFDWDLGKYYWPRERVLRWWGQGWDWESLKAKPCSYAYYEDHFAYFRETFEGEEIRFPDPRMPGLPRARTEDSPKISEKVYWGERWLTEFPPGSGKLWDPYHLPLFDPETGDLSPKHRDCKGDNRWLRRDRDAFRLGLIARMAVGRNDVHDTAEDANAPLSGIVVPPMTFFYELLEKKMFVDFSEALFAYGVLFGDASFGAQSNLSNAYFGEPRMFRRASFARGVTFAHSVFTDAFDFSSAKFDTVIDFSKTIFLGNVSFAHAPNADDGIRTGRVEADKKADGAYIICLDKQHDAREEGAFQDVSFEGAEFFGDADFSGRHFAGKADFFGAKFHKIPIFHRATFAQDPIWSVDRSFFPAPGCRTASPRTLVREPKSAWLKPAAAWVNRLWSAIPHSDWGSEDRTKRSIEFELAYRRLKTLMLDMGARTAEHFFYTMEVKSRIKRNNVSRFEKVLAYLYWWVSDFGQSLWRPIIGLIAVNAATYYGLCRLSGVGNRDLLRDVGDFFADAWRFVLGLFGAAQPLDFFETHSNQSEAFSYLAHNFIPGGWLHDIAYTADLDRSAYQDWINGLYQSNKVALYGLGAAHEIATLALLFLFALALKRRFQIK